MINCTLKSENEVQLLCMDSKEAEAVKLFSNTFLAMRISFFNELESPLKFIVLLFRGVTTDMG